MPNYFVTNTARFNPFSYQELALPLMQATEAQYALEDVLSTVDDGTLETYLAREDSNSPYRERYNSLTDRLQAASNELASRGLNPALMREVKALRGDYNRFKTPVETAGKRKAQDVAIYNKAYLSDPSLIGDNPSDRDLQWYIDHPDYSPKYTSGKLFQTYGATIGQELASQFSPTYTPIQGGKFYEVQTKRTATMKEIQNNPEYRNAVDNIMKAHGFNPEDNDSFTNRVRQEVETGMYMGMQDRGLQRVSNPGWSSGSTKTEKETDYVYSSNGARRYHKVGDKWAAQDKMKDSEGNDAWSVSYFPPTNQLKEDNVNTKAEPSPKPDNPAEARTGYFEENKYKSPTDLIHNKTTRRSIMNNDKPITQITKEQAKELFRNSTSKDMIYSDNDDFMHFVTSNGDLIRLTKSEYEDLRKEIGKDADRQIKLISSETPVNPIDITTLD